MLYSKKISIAGLWAARICADHFEDVLIFEPEEWLSTEEGRTSVYDQDGQHKNPDIKPRARTRVGHYDSLHGLLYTNLFHENIMSIGN